MKSGRFVGPDRAAVVGNIRRAVAAKAFNIKVEEHDPVFSKSEEQRIVTHYLQQRRDRTCRAFAPGNNQNVADGGRSEFGRSLFRR